MDETLLDFVRVLRNADLNVSPAETLDALHAVQSVGIDQRSRLHDALAATLAKTAHDKETFDYCFAEFFSQRGLDSEQLLEGSDPAEAELEQLLEQEPLSSGGIEGHGELAPLSAMLLQGDNDGMAVALGQAADTAQLNDIRFFTQKGQYSRRIMENLGLEALDRDIHALEQTAADRSPGRAEAERLKQGRKRLWDRVSDYVERHYLLYARQNEWQLRDSVLKSTRLSNLEQRDLHRLRLLVRRMARRLAARYSRRRRVVRRGQLDIPRTLRAGTATDGILFERHWRSRRRDRPCVLAVCDVSGSVRAHARFLLLFLYSLAEVLPRIRSYVFCSELTEVSSLFSTVPPEEAIETALHRFATGSTDYGTSLRQLLAGSGRSIDQGSTLIVLGDARNNYGDPALGTMREIAQRARRVFWLNPESRSSWQTGDSEMLRYAAYCSDARVCQNLQQLERFGSDLLRHAY